MILCLSSFISLTLYLSVSFEISFFLNFSKWAHTFTITRDISNLNQLSWTKAYSLAKIFRLQNSKTFISRLKYAEKVIVNYAFVSTGVLRRVQSNRDGRLVGRGPADPHHSHGHRQQGHDLRVRRRRVDPQRQLFNVSVRFETSSLKLLFLS